MLQKNNRYKVLKVFLFFSTDKFGLREISRMIGLALPSVKKYLRELESEGLIRVINERGNPIYFSERDSEKFKFYQRLAVQYELFESGIIDYIWKKLSPEAIILYGSYCKGDAISNSDIDLFVIGKKSEINLERYEKTIEKEVHLLINEQDKISKELKNNLTNGIVLKGYFKILK